VSLGDWLDERMGWRRLLAAALDEPVAGGARWSYVFGSVLLALLGVQVLTGVALAAFYAPSASSAWASVAYLERQVRLGWFIRGVHSTSASAMMIVALLHLAQVALFGAYKRPRELNWLVGLMLYGCLFGFALTGYLLPWDQKGYWATQVATTLVGLVPGIGAWLERVLVGGRAYGNLTLTHFFALHTLVLPALTVVLVGVHVALMRRHGVTPAWWQRADERERATEPFWPGQGVRDLGAAAIAVAAVTAWVAWRHGAGLAAPADPSSSYDARPEWYFLPLYQLLKYFPGRLEIVAALGAPLVAVGLLGALPFLDRGASSDPAARKRFLAAVGLVVGGAALLGVRAELADRRNPDFQRARVAAERASERALARAARGVPAAGPLALEADDPLARGRRVFAERCRDCHSYDGAGTARAPELDGWSSRAWLRALLLDPDAPRFYGKTKVRGMKPVKARGEELDALVEWIWSAGGSPGVNLARAERGRDVFAASSCDDCHDTDGTSGGDGAPNLGGRGSAAWLRAFLEDPSEARFFAGKNHMPKFRDKLSAADLDALVALLSAERLR
jgi:ubiquinol-cytochrome c reductase cytochrome b subunit